MVQSTSVFRFFKKQDAKLTSRRTEVGCVCLMVLHPLSTSGNYSTNTRLLEKKRLQFFHSFAMVSNMTRVVALFLLFARVSGGADNALLCASGNPSGTSSSSNSTGDNIVLVMLPLSEEDLSQKRQAYIASVAIAFEVNESAVSVLSIRAVDSRRWRTQPSRSLQSSGTCQVETCITPLPQSLPKMVKIHLDNALQAHGLPSSLSVKRANVILDRSREWNPAAVIIGLVIGVLILVFFIMLLFYLSGIERQTKVHPQHPRKRLEVGGGGGDERGTAVQSGGQKSKETGQKKSFD